MADPIFNLVSFKPFNFNPLNSNNVGSRSKPTLVDIDDDGDLDAFVGNAFGDTLFFLNTGTLNKPVFAAPSINPFGLSDVGDTASPTFVDIDGDGDLDAFVGNDTGYTLFFKNSGTVSDAAFEAPITSPFGLPFAMYTANPTFVDIDGDADLDVFVGDFYGRTIFSKNTGTASNPIFTAPSINPFGLSDVGFSSSPWFTDIDSDGDLDAFVGNFVGNTLFFRNTGTTNNPIFTAPSTNPFGLIEVASINTDATPTFVDIDGDGDLDAFVGSDGIGDTLFFWNAPVVLLTSTAGNDIFIGTTVNNDTVTYASAATAITVSLAITTQQNTVGSGFDTLSNIENLIGSNFNDNLKGNAKNNTLNGGAGNDVLNGGAEGDILIGGSGNDNYVVDNIGDAITENIAEGTDKISSSITYTLPDNVENLTLTGSVAINGAGNGLANILIGNAAINRLFGDAGNDTLNGAIGGDTMFGGLGNDNYIVDNIGDVVTENLNAGIDKVNSSITYTLPNNVENLTLTGAVAINGTGNSLANTLIGNSATNVLNGGAGNDKLDGGIGINTLTGGAGKDIFKITTTGHVDTFTDFVVVDDTTQLENSAFKALTTLGTLNINQFRIGPNALDVDDFVIYNSATGKLLYDADGSGGGAALEIANIGAGLAMTNADIVVI